MANSLSLSFPNNLADITESVQKRAPTIIFPDISNKESLLIVPFWFTQLQIQVFNLHKNNKYR